MDVANLVSHGRLIDLTLLPCRLRALVIKGPESMASQQEHNVLYPSPGKSARTVCMTARGRVLRRPEARYRTPIS